MKEYARLILVLLIPLLLISAYSISDRLLNLNGFTVAKARLWQRTLSDWSAFFQDSTKSDEVQIINNIQQQKDSISVFLQIDTVVCHKAPDTCGKHILFFGDSMVEGLSMRFSDYAQENGHELYSVCWYGSTTTGWASNLDTLRSFLKWSEADYIVVSLGGNELRVKDLDNRAENIKKIQEALGDRPTVWIAPPSWINNPTITEVICSVVGDSRYFDSTRLKFNRGSDNMHPTFGSSSRWMDSIAVWLSSAQTEHPILMDMPSKTYPRKWKKRFIFPD